MKKSRNKQPTLKEIRDAVYEMFYNRLPVEKRDTVLYCGKGGVIMYLEAFGPISQETKDSYEDTPYQIKNGVITECAIYDEEMKDGINGVKRNGQWYIEEWKDNYRSRYYKVSEEEFNKMKEEHEK